MHELKHRFTIVIVTHNMQQAARVADRTAFFSLDTTGPERFGALIEYGETETIFRGAVGFAHAGLRRGPLRLSAAYEEIESLGTCCRIGWPHCQQYDAPVLCGAPQEAHSRRCAVCSRRRIRSISLSSESASWSRAARLTSTSTRMRSRMAIS